ncbi:monocarboxylate transporter 13-like isoform X3 [Cylas formicarius]|uniref:monocarboxylate transporter 13-like isoform X3 n=1 Tax=Cylas formicarius TaxID=197179 RepID=UPI0029589726|nr:monocarboxylate transporter 13-like isoform X3 [Cylas formicarius]
MGKDKEFVHPDGGYGWIIVVSIVVINSSLLTLIQCFGIIFRDEFKEWNITSAQTSFLLHLQSSLYCSFGFFCSPLLKRYSMRMVAYIGATLMCSGIFLSSFATSYTYLMLSVSLLTGIGQGILMPVTYLATYTYFKKRLTIAVSLSVTGASISSIVMPKICDSLLTYGGRRTTVLILFGVSLLSLLACYLLKPIKSKKATEEGIPLEIEGQNGVSKKSQEGSEELLKTPSNEVYNTTTIPARKQRIWTKISNLFDLQLLKDIPFVLIIIGLGSSFAAELNVILMLQFILRELSGLTRSEVATAVSVQSVADIIGRLVVPLLSHTCNAPSKVMYCGALLIACFGRLVLSCFSYSKTAVYISIAIIGLTKGCRAVFQSVIIPKYVTLDKIPAATGLHMLFTGAVSLIIGPIIEEQWRGSLYKNLDFLMRSKIDKQSWTRILMGVERRNVAEENPENSVSITSQDSVHFKIRLI